MIGKIIGKKKPFGASGLLDDLSLVVGSVINLVSAGRAQIRREIRQRADSMAGKLDLVPRSEFERVEALLIRSREEQEKLGKRLADLEKKGASPASSHKASRAGKKT